MSKGYRMSTEAFRPKFIPLNVNFIYEDLEWFRKLGLFLRLLSSYTDDKSDRS